MNLNGKKVLITGAAKRIGREIALSLADGGADIAIHYSHSAREAAQLEKEIASFGVKAWRFQCDFSPQGGTVLGRIRGFVKEVLRKAGGVDVLINNASVFYSTPAGSVTEAQWDEFLTVNLKAPFFLAQEFGARMFKAKSGKIINLIDWTAGRPSARFLPYAISKAGLDAATKGLAKQLAPYVQVVSIAPGPILPAVNATREEQRKAAERSLLKRYGDPKDIANTVRFFLEDTDFVTGSTLFVDGGAAIV